MSSSKALAFCNTTVLGKRKILIVLKSESICNASNQNICSIKCVITYYNCYLLRTIVSAIGFLSGSKVLSMSSNRSRCDSESPLTGFGAATLGAGRSSSRLRRSLSFSMKMKKFSLIKLSKT